MIEDKIIDAMAEEIQKEIDEGVMLNLLVEGGWIKVRFTQYDIPKKLKMIKYCEQTFRKKQWLVLNGHFVFRKKQDAEWFILKWT